MRVIPVIDLRRGVAVHAVKGHREHYRPLNSVLCGASDPNTVVRSFRDQLGLSEIYVADLDAIQGSGRTHRTFIKELAGTKETNIMLDAGATDVETARDWLQAGVHKVVIGAETLPGLHELWEIPDGIDRDRLVFSLDMLDGKILSKCPDLAAISPVQALELLQSAGWREVILLDLRRVGSEEGVDSRLILESRSAFPGLNLLAGGGISNLEQLAVLKSAGISGVLVSTVLHRGLIGPRQLSALSST